MQTDYELKAKELVEWIDGQIRFCESEILASKFLIMHDKKLVKEYWTGKLDAYKEMKVRTAINQI